MQHGRRQLEPGPVNEIAQGVGGEPHGESLAQAAGIPHQPDFAPGRDQPKGLGQIPGHIPGDRSAGFLDWEQFRPPETIFAAGFPQHLPFRRQRLIAQVLPAPHPVRQLVVGEGFNVRASPNVRFSRHHHMEMPHAVPVRFQNAYPILITLGNDVGREGMPTRLDEIQVFSPLPKFPRGFRSSAAPWHTKDKVSSPTRLIPCFLTIPSTAVMSR